MAKIVLSFQDRFLLAFEREDLPFNSYFYFESLTPFNLEKVKASFLKLYELEPQLNITSCYNTGNVEHFNFSREDYSKSFVEIATSEAEKAFLEKPFVFQKDPPVRLASLNKDNKFYIIFSFHHPLFDGHAQINFLKDFCDIYNGVNYVPRKINDLVHFRSYL
ncbi:MAG: hypothetical protein K2Q18_14490, partial [Bdellovibrionales bacterium]|nr:hypothetical protein [Bdellovibrionales bacterium]